MKKKGIIFFISLTIIFSINGEKWVGQAATYQLLDGSKTANGELFKRESLSGACNGFKFGSEVVVTNVKTGKQITVVINDRIKKDSNYFLLLTPEAAGELGLEWETGLVVVDANFSDVNSTERLFVNGLVPEGELDLESLKKFPEIIWPEEDETVNDKVHETYEHELYPQKDKEQVVPLKKETETMIDHDDKDGYKFEEKEKAIPQKELMKKPDYEEKEDKLDVDEDIFYKYHEDIEEPMIEIVETPEKKMREYALDEDMDKDFPQKDFIKSPEQKRVEMDYDIDEEFPEEDKYIIPEIEKELIDEDLVEEHIEEEKKIEWVKKLNSGKIYIRFSTTFDREEGERRMMLFQKVFPNVIGLKKAGRYILFVGPVEKEKINRVLNSIRKFGYKDAYIVQK